MMTVAAIIEQAQNRWMENPMSWHRAGLQFQGSYCKYYFYIFTQLFIVQSIWRAFTWRKRKLLVGKLKIFTIENI